MRRAMLIISLFMLVFSSSVAVGADDFMVRGFTPRGEISGKPEIKVVFSSPVVPESLLGKILPKDQIPLDFSPSLSGRAVWDDTQTLLFTPDDPLSRATSYRATVGPIRDLSGRLLAGTQTFSFNTPPLKLLSARQVSITPYGEMSVELRFSMPVPPKRLLGFLSGRSDGKSVRLRPQGEVPSDRITVASERIPGDSLTVVVEKGLTSDEGPLGLEKTEKVTLKPSSSVKITGTYTETETVDRGKIVIYTSRPVDPGDVKGYVSVSPERSFRVESTYGGFALVGEFPPRERIILSLKKGLGGGDGLVADERRTFIMPDVPRSIRFPVAGTFLTPFDDPRIAVETVNVDRLRLRGWKLYPNNVPVAMGVLDGGSELSTSLTRRLEDWELPIDNRVNETIRGAVDLEAYLGQSRGVFMLEASDEDSGWTRARQLVTLTDLGLSARVYDDGLMVWLDGLSTGKPVEGAEISVYSSSNQLLAEGVTDGDGIWSVVRDGDWDPQLLPSVVVARLDEDLTFLSLSGNLFADNGMDVSGSPWNETYEGQCLLPRGIFRPGESVQITSVVRGPRMSMPGRFPLMWRLVDSLGYEMFRGRTELSSSGIATGSFDLPDAAPSGKYRFELFVPGDEGSPLADASFLVEDFTPPKIELGLNVPEGPLSSGGTMDLSFRADYLFGAPAGGLAWEAKAFSRESVYRSERFPDFSFGDGEVSYEGGEIYLGGGDLDGSGEGSLSWTVPDDWRTPPMIDLAVSLNVMEAGGRWVTRTEIVPCALNPVQIGVRFPEGDVLPNEPVQLKIAAVNPKDEPIRSGGISWALFSLVDRPVLVRDDGRTRMRWEEERSEVASGKAELKDGLADLTVVPEGNGRYLLTFSGKGGSTGSIRFDAWAPWGGASRKAVLPGKVELTLDKESYSFGDRAVLSYSAPFTGTGLFTFEANGIIERKVVDVSEPEGRIEFVPSSEAWPNGWCTFQVVRPVSDKDEWSSHRALGVVPVKMDPGYRASLSLDVPEKAEPGGTLNLSVETRDEDGKAISGDLWVALVDKGILGLTGHETPDPWEAFTARRALASRASDLYDELMPIESRETPLLHPAGGDGAEARAAFGVNLSPVRARGFRVLSMVKTVASDGGKVDLSFDLPEFSGGARVMAVFSGSSVGSAHTDLSISRPITVDPTVPDALAPGDMVLVPVQLISTAKEDLKLHMDMKAEGSLSLEGAVSDDLVLSAGESSVVYLKVRGSDRAGTGSLSVRLLGDGMDFSVRRDTVVRPPMPRITVSGSEALDKGVFEMPEKGRWFPGTLRASLYLSGAPNADLMPVVQFLDRYPYGCLEQTVSALWPSVTLGDMADRIGLSISVPDRIARLQTMQLYDGSFSYWPEGEVDRWGSLYAAHLLASMAEEEVPLSMMHRTEGYLRSVLSESSESAFDLSRKAYAAYVMSLSEQPPLGWMAWLSERIGEMDSAGRYLLAGAYGLAGKRDLGLKLLGGADLSGSDRYGSAVRDMALRLLAMEDLAPGSSDEAFLAAQLSKAVEAGDLSTHEAGLAVLTLGRFSRRSDVKPFFAEVTGGDDVFKMAAGDELALSSDSFVSWRVDNAGPGRLFCGWSLSGVPLDPVEPFDKGISVRRTLRNADGEPIDGNGSLSLGDEVVLSIEVTPTGKVKDLVVVDMLPGCLEVWKTPSGFVSGGSSVRRDVRFDRVLFFPSSVEKTLKLEYRCRVTARGDFLWPPVYAEGMYDSSIRSVSGGGRLSVR